jgi:pimeloyl-ACP methyl ester carboxylesterase
MYERVNDMSVYYEEHGRPDAPALVLLHGYTVTGRITWDEHLDALATEYRLIVPDSRGHGLTDNPAGPSAMNHHQFTRDVSTFCDRLGIERAAFCGYSSGAMVAMNLALARPDLVAAAVLTSGTFTIPEATRAMMRAMTVTELAHSWFGEPVDSAEPYPELFTSAHRALGPDHWQIVMADFLAGFSRPDAEDYPEPDALSQIQAPILILHGDRDAFFPVEIPVEMYRRLPDAELSVLPQTPHELVQAQPELFRTLVMDFLSRRYPVTAR